MYFFLNYSQMSEKLKYIVFQPCTLDGSGSILKNLSSLVSLVWWFATDPHHGSVPGFFISNFAVITWKFPQDLNFPVA